MRRGFSVIEMIVVVGIISVLSALGYWTYSSTEEAVSRSAAQNTVRAVILAEQRLYQREGILIGAGLELAALEESFSYVNADVPSTGPGEVSIGLIEYNGSSGVALAVRDESACVFAVIPTPDVEAAASVSRSATDGVCSADQWLREIERWPGL